MEGWIMADIRTSQFGGVPFGTSETRPASPSIGQTYYNGTLGVQEIYTSSGWLPATGANDFNVTLNGLVTTATFTKEYFEGAYTINSALSDSTYDIYVYNTQGAQVGYTKSPSLTATGNFNKIVIVGGSSGDLLSFSYKTTFTATNTTGEVTAGAFLTSATPTALNSINDTTTLVGGNFASNVAVYFVGSDNVERAAKSIVRSSSSQLIVTRPDNFATNLGTYKLVVENPGITRPTGSSLHILNNAITAGTTPNWTTPTTLPEPRLNSPYSTTLVATDSEGTDIDYSVISGSLPLGFSLNNETGVISGTPEAYFPTTSFTVRAVDTGGNTVDRTFSITLDSPVWVTSSLSAYAGSAYSQTLSATDSSTITYSLISGSLPTGITLNSSTGLISGTTSESSNRTLVFRATDSGGNLLDRSFLLEYNPVKSISGLHVYFEPSGLNSAGTAWADSSGNGRNITMSGTNGKVTVPAGSGASNSIQALDVLQSTPPFNWTNYAASSSNNYTVFHVARYKDSGVRGRIFNGGNANWLSGFHSSKAGCQFHEGWLAESDIHGRNWVVSTDKHNYYRSNGTVRGTSGNNAYTLTAIDTNGSEASDSYIAEFILFNRALNDTEIGIVESFLRSRYSI
jgi:hypothetical protein